MFLIPMVPDTEFESLESQVTEGIYRAPVDRVGLAWAPAPGVELDLAAGGGAALSLSSVRAQLRISR